MAAGDCPLANAAALSSGVILPNFISYNATTLTLKIAPVLSAQVGTYTVRVTSHLNDGVSTYRNSYQDITFTIFCANSLSANPSSITVSLEAVSQNFSLPSITQTPSDSIVTISFSATGAPSFFSVSGSQGVISSAAIAGSYTFTITATDSICNVSTTINVNLTLYSCAPTGFMLAPSSVLVSGYGPS